MSLSLRKTTEWMSFALCNHKQVGAFFEPLIQSYLPGWTVNGFRAQIKEIGRESGSVVSLTLHPDQSWQGFQAGQYINLTVEINGAKLTRCFSISSSPEAYRMTGTIRLTIREQDQGVVTPWLATGLKKGGYVSLSAACGEFVVQDKVVPKVFIAAGVGITPILSMLSDLVDQGESKPVKLLYYGSDHLFRSELSALESAKSNFSFDFLNTRESGYFDRETVQRLLEQYAPEQFENPDYYICGPGEMITSVEQILKDSGVSPEKIHFEFFGVPRVLDAQVSESGQASRAVAFSQTQAVVSVEPGDRRTLLEIAEGAGLNPVHGCRAGVCHQCSCRKLGGRVQNILTGQVSDGGAELVQLCISQPVDDVELAL